MTSKQFCLTRMPDLYVKHITINSPSYYRWICICKQIRWKKPRYKKGKIHSYHLHGNEPERLLKCGDTEVKAWQQLKKQIMEAEAIDRKIIRILQASQDGVWYSTHIGQAYYVVRPKNEEDQELYYQIENSPTLLIRKSDCKVVTNRHE